MPHSPLTRFLAILLVVAFAVVMFWPEESAYAAAGYSLGGLMLALGIFTWSAVRGAPPFDDHAFHRSLPPGDGAAFRSVLGIHLLMIGGFVLIVLVHCLRYGFGWRAMTYGAAAVTLPVLALISLVGIISSVASARQHWRLFAWTAVVFLPLLCIYWVRWATGGLDGERWGWNEVYFPAVRTIVLTAAGLYPLIWWLVAVRRRKVLGLVFGAATGALLPWLFVYGYFVPVPPSQLDPRGGAANPNPGLQLVRKTIPEDSGQWLPLSELFEVKGLAEGEFASLEYLTVDLDSKNRGHTLVPVWETRESTGDVPWSTRMVRPVTIRKLDGRIVWGEQGVWEHLRTRIPATGSFGYWSRGRSLDATLAISKPGREVSYTGASGHGNFTYRDDRAGQLMMRPWKTAVARITRWASLGDCSLTEGGSFRMKDGGTLKVIPLSQNGLKQVVTFKMYNESLSETDGPWFGPAYRGFHDLDDALKVVMVDASGKHAFALDTLSPQPGARILLGGYYEWSFVVSPSGDLEETKRNEMMNGARLYLFLPKIDEDYRTITMPPP
ncbi:hypothetical protein [Luteolibacter sp. Populi]|uniref:hypothetical protein n=1 Tax=Luteolibacter sp. Populi TaxID=3230487 RepID=UPI003465A21A